MAGWLTDRIEFYKQIIEDERESLEVLESGRIRFWTREAGGPEVDRTQEAIVRHKRNIAVLTHIIERAEHP